MTSRSNLRRASGLLKAHGPLFILCIGLITLALFACDATIGPVRATSFPPDLDYIPPERIEATMWVLAAEIRELERLLGDEPSDVNRTNRFATLAALERMRVAARSLDEPGRSSQHPVLDRNIDVFLERLERAIQHVQRDPPDFFLASTIAGSCYLCHGRTNAVAIEHGMRRLKGG